LLLSVRLLLYITVDRILLYIAVYIILLYITVDGILLYITVDSILLYITVDSILNFYEFSINIYFIFMYSPRRKILYTVTCLS
jgi:hypothetical protein